MRLSLSRTLGSSKTLPRWILVHIKLLAEVPQILPLEEMAEMAKPVWRLPSGVRAVALILSLAGLVGGVRVLDAQIANQQRSEDAATGTNLGANQETVDPLLMTSPSSIVQDATEETATPAVGDARDAPTGLIVEEVPKGDTHQFLSVTVSGYCSNSQATASSRPCRPGTVALSRDLLRIFTPDGPFRFGDRVLIPGMGVYVVEDAMAPRWSRKADIWFDDEATARRWGVRTVYIARITAGEPLFLSSSWNR